MNLNKCILSFLNTTKKLIYRKICDAAVMAIADLKNAVPYIARGEAKGISFVRRFLLKSIMFSDM